MRLPVEPLSDDQVKATLIDRVPGYIPEWQPIEGSSAVALTQAYARYRALLNTGLQNMPRKLQAAMLDIFGLRLQPAQGARVPLVFTISPDSAADVTLAAGSQVAATPAAQLPSLEPGAAPPQLAEPPLFATERTITLTPGILACLYSVDPRSDRYSDHTTALAQGFETFTNMELIPHELYLGHDTLFALGGNDISLIVSFTMDSGAPEPLNLRWDYFSDSDWVPLPYLLQDDTTAGLMTSGQVTLRRSCGPNAQKKQILGQESYWIRASLATPYPVDLPPGKISVNDIRVKVKFSKADLPPEAAFADATSLDITKDFYPLGERPGPTATFYLASNEVFSRGGSRVQIDFLLSERGSGSPQLTWEYFASGSWKSLADDPAVAFTTSAADKQANVLEPNGQYFSLTSDGGTASFACPSDWEETEVNGVRNRWLRVRLASGGFSSTQQLTGGLAIDVFHPPRVGSIAMGFDYLTAPEPLHHCVSYNDFRFEDQTGNALWPDRRFEPFKPVSDEMPAIHFGFSRKLPAGLASMYFQSPVAAAAPGIASPFQWEYLAADGWHELPVLDETAGFQRSGMVQFISGADAVSANGLPLVDGLPLPLYRIRARLRAGEEMTPSNASGIWLNAVWAIHRRNIERELLGRSNGTPDQTFQFGATPVLEGETIEVEEWFGRGESWKLALSDVPDARRRFDVDPISREVIRVWVRWTSRPYLHDAGPDDRVYTIERATGKLALGLRVPLAGQRLVASYRTGGGVAGNVGNGTVKNLRLVQPMIIGASNPVPAAGGADAEALVEALKRGPQVLRHRNRALTVQDVEWLAREASPQVAITRCLPLVGGDGKAQRGWLKVLVVPHSTDPMPAPSEELAREVQEFLTQHGMAGVRVIVRGPQYMPVALRAIIVPDVPGESALVEARVRIRLARFLHPLSGSEGNGWEFGQAVALSRVAALVEATPGVAYAPSMVLTAGGTLCGAYAQPGAEVLPCEGVHELTLHLGDL